MEEASSTAAAVPSSRRAFTAPLRIFSAPTSVLADVKAGLPWWPGLLVLVVLAFFFLQSGLLLLPLQRELMTADVAAGKMQGLKLDEVGQLPAPLRWSLIGGLIGGPLVGMPVMLVAVTFFTWLTLTITFGGAPFRRLFTLSVYSSFIGIAFQVINTLYLRFAGLELTTLKDLQHSSLKLSLGAVVEGEGFLANFLSQIGVFELWGLWILISGAALLLERKRSAVATPLLVLFLISSTVGAFLAKVFARYSG
jgi:hypothetical protein